MSFVVLDGQTDNRHGAAVMAAHKKWPRDANRLANSIVDIATGEVEDSEPTPEEQGKDPADVSLGRRGGLKGGKARAKKLSYEHGRKLRARLLALAGQRETRPALLARQRGSSDGSHVVTAISRRLASCSQPQSVVQAGSHDMRPRRGHEFSATCQRPALRTSPERCVVGRHLSRSREIWPLRSINVSTLLATAADSTAC